MSKFGRYDCIDNDYTDNKYKKPVKSGDYVYIFDIDELYEGKTIYKVHCMDDQKILVEVDPIKNKVDLEVVSGWSSSSRRADYIECYKLERGKLYWWVSVWLKTNNNFINNE